jgi:hypothetical protein
LGADSAAKRAALVSAAAAQAKSRPLITHDDSLKIAEAVRKRLDALRIKDSVAKVQLADQTARKMTDSIIAANSGAVVAATSGPRRLVIVEPLEQRNWPEAVILGRAVADSLRRMLRGRSRQYTVVSPDSVRIALAQTHDLGELTRSLNSDLLVSIRLIQMPHDSAMLQLQAYDIGAIGQFRQRSAIGKQVPKNQVLSTLDVQLLSTLTNLDEMIRAPRRPPPPPPPV